MPALIIISTSGLDRALQHAIGQIVGYIVLIVGILIVLDNAGIHRDSTSYVQRRVP